jgi:hypothetical protein
MEAGLEIFGEARSPDELHSAIRDIAALRGATCAGLDEVGGLTGGYTAKLLAGTKQFGAMSLFAMLGALGTKLQLVDDPEARERFGKRLNETPRQRAPKVGPTISPTVRAAVLASERKWRRARLRRKIRERLAAMTPEQRSESARRAAQARWAALTPEQRANATAPARRARKRNRKAAAHANRRT